MTEQKKLDGRTKRAADIALAKRLISPASYRALVEEGRISLQEAKKLGRDRGPDDASEASDGQEEPRKRPREGHTPRPCLCSCGGTTKGGRFLPGHDARLRSELVAQIKKGDVLLRSDRITAEQRAFAVRHGLISEETLPEEEQGG
jgi:hypothetical protein